MAEFGAIAEIDPQVSAHPSLRARQRAVGNRDAVGADGNAGQRLPAICAHAAAQGTERGGMSKLPRDAEPDELSLFTQWRPVATTCPRPELLFPALEGVLPADVAGPIVSHV